MTNLKPELFKEIYDFLCPHMDEKDRKTLITPAFSSCENFYSKIEWGGSSKEFTVKLIKLCQKYGEIKRNQQALELLIDVVKDDNGLDVQSDGESLLRMLQESHAPQTTSTTKTIPYTKVASISEIKTSTSINEKLPDIQSKRFIELDGWTPDILGQGGCSIEFNNSAPCTITINLDYEDILKYLVTGRNDLPEHNTRKFLKPLDSGEFELSIGSIDMILSKVDAIDLCEQVDLFVNDYVASILSIEDSLAGWGLQIRRLYKDTYGYELFSVPIETWNEMKKFAGNHQGVFLGKHKFFTTQSVIRIETSSVTHAAIAPKIYIGADGLPGFSLLYLMPEYNHPDWQNDVNVEGTWTIEYTKKWLLKYLIPSDCYDAINKHSDSGSQPTMFDKITNTRQFQRHISTVQGWIRLHFGRNIHIDDIFIDYFEAFNQLIKVSKVEQENSIMQYIGSRINRLQDIPCKQQTDRRAPFEPDTKIWTLEEINIILNKNLIYLRDAKYVKTYNLELMFRGHEVMIRDAHIEVAQYHINKFKNALWPLYERASFETRFPNVWE